MKIEFVRFRTDIPTISWDSVVGNVGNEVVGLVLVLPPPPQ